MGCFLCQHLVTLVAAFFWDAHSLSRPKIDTLSYLSLSLSLSSLSHYEMHNRNSLSSSLSLSHLSLYEMHNRNSLSSSLSLNLPFSVPNSNTVHMKRAQMIVFHSHSIIHLMGLVPKVSLSPSLLPSLPPTHAYVVFHSMELFRRRNVLMAC